MSVKDINALTICPFHRSELGEGARIPTEFQMIAGMSALISLEIERAVQEVGGTTDTKDDLAFVTLQSKHKHKFPEIAFTAFNKPRRVQTRRHL